MNGTPTDTISFIFGNITLDKGVYKGVGHSLPKNRNYWLQFTTLNESSYVGGSSDEEGEGTIITLNEKTTFIAKVVIPIGVTLDNDLVKPMLTTDLNATYDDFISYDDCFVQNSNISNKVTNGGSISTVKALTQSEYDAISTKDNNTVYFVME